MNINHNRIRKYFAAVSIKPGVTAIVIGLVMFLIGKPFTIFLGLILICGGVWWLYSQLGNKPTDEEVDQSAQSVMEGIRQRSMDRLGIDESEVALIKPMIAQGYSFDPIGGTLGAKQGKDGKVRTSTYEGIVIYFAEQVLHSYKVRFSLVDPSAAPYEETDEYFYRDVVSISTQTTAKRALAKEIPREEFRLTTSGGTSVTSAFENSGTAGNTFQAARQLIRDKKAALN